MAQPMLIVVERVDLTLYETLREKYAGVQDLIVIRDRRRTRRRRRPQMRHMDRRRGDRRRQPEKDEQLRAVGSFSTPLLAEPAVSLSPSGLVMSLMGKDEPSGRGSG